MPSSPSNIRELAGPTTPADLTNIEQSNNLSGQDENSTTTPPAANDNDPPAMSQELPSSPPPVSNEAIDITEPNDVTATPEPANDNPAPFSETGS